MASVGAEYEEQLKAWIKAFEALPPDRKDRMTRWFATQRLIAENAGLALADWCKYLEWALHHPFDYSFVLDFPAKGGGLEADAAERSSEADRAQRLVGGETAKTPLAAGPGIQEMGKSPKEVDKELFDRFMHARMKPGAK